MNSNMLGPSLCTLLYNHGATSCIQLWRPLAYAADVEGEEDGNVNMFAEFLPPSPSTSPLSTSSSGPWCCIQLWVCTGPYKRTALDAHNVRGRNLNSNKSYRNIRNTEYGGTENLIWSFTKVPWTIGMILSKHLCHRHGKDALVWCTQEALRHSKF